MQKYFRENIAREYVTKNTFTQVGHIFSAIRKFKTIEMITFKNSISVGATSKIITLKSQLSNDAE